MPYLRQSTLSLAISFAICYGFANFAQAQEETAPQKLDSVTVKASSKQRVLTEKTRVTHESIATHNLGNSNVTDLLKNNPVIQFSNQSESSLQQGEIKPSHISIHGNTAYQNNYMIDGISMNSDLDPAQQADVTVTRLGGSHEQGFFVDANLIDSVDVYDANVPASLGFFKGGVVDVKTRSWQGQNHFSVWGRTTQSGWSHIFKDPALDITQGGDVAHQAQFQTDFTKREYGASATFGINDSVGFVVGASRRESKIPTIQPPLIKATLEAPDPFSYEVQFTPVPGGMLQEKRTSDNAFVKGTAYVGQNTTIDLSLGMSRYRSHSFLSNVVDSAYNDNHNAFNGNLTINHRFSKVRWLTDLSYTHMEDTRDSEVDDWFQFGLYDYSEKKLTTFATGGLGDLKSFQNVLTLKSRLDFDSIDLGATNHKISTGVEIFDTRAQYKRDKDYFRRGIMGMVMGDSTMVQPMATTTVWRKGSYKANYFTQSLWLEDTLTYKRLTLRPGVRVDHDGFNGKVNVAPRLSASFDLLGNKQTILGMGANRYYGRSLLSYALYKGQNEGLYNAYDWVKSWDQPDAEWFHNTDFAGLNKLKTPYDDELLLSITQQVKGWKGKLSYVYRRGKDGVRSSYESSGAGYNTTWSRVFNNLGESKHESVLFRLENNQLLTIKGINNQIALSVAWSKTKSNQDLGRGYSLQDVKNEGVNDDYVLYDGKLIKAKDLDATDFNIPIKFNFEITSTWDRYGLTWYNLFHLDSSRNQAELEDGVMAEVQSPDDGYSMKVKQYKKVHYPVSWVWNTKLTYRPQFAKGLSASIEINNVLNRKNVQNHMLFKGQTYTNYAPGRQFWLGLNYEY